MAKDTFEFFGTKSEYEEFKRKNIVAASEDKSKKDNHKDKEERHIPVLVISPETATDVDPETLRMLRRTRHIHDSKTVYMQSDISFYDSFYTSDEDSVVDDKELLQEARSIRRVYKSYPDYLYALTIRDLYIEALEEKVGNNLLFSTMSQSNGNKYWFPPMPIYSKRSEDYENGKYGIIDTSDIFEWDDDAIIDTLHELSQVKGIAENPDDIEVEYSVVTDLYTISHGNIEREHNVSTGRSVNLADMDELQKIFHSWYQDDAAKSSKRKAEENSLANRAFSRTPERIIRDYYMSKIPTLSQSITDMMNDVPAPSTYNPNEMVYDDVSGKPMSRKEYDARSLFRMLKNAGWTNELKMMRLLGVGSSREYSILKTKARKKKRRENKTVQSYLDSYDTGIYGDENVNDIGIYSDLDSLKAQMFPD